MVGDLILKKIVKKIPPPLHNTFSFAVDVTGRSGRDQHGLSVSRVRINYGKQSLAYRGTIIWYRLLLALYSAETAFKKIVLYVFVLCVHVRRLLILYCTSQGIAVAD